MREPENIQELETLRPDFIGFIFYEKSPRYVAVADNQGVISGLDSSIIKVGVFVKEPIESLMSLVSEFDLDFVQLHGGEDLDYCTEVKKAGIKIIKVFSVKDQLPLEQIHEFEEVVEYFLFDTKTPEYGGSGRHFDWSILKDYNSDKPFLLSGGIKNEDLDEIMKLDIPQLFALDVNSKYESAPGVKNIELIKELDKALQINEDIREV
ncbi:MAG: phosphoribosylanthranilate isomerase [bacterium]|nr:phosphoribosylanthranilate isomerase [bacterium]